MVHTHLSKQEGLPTNEFYDVQEDKDGFIWLGGEEGVFRFDGHSYKKYMHPKQKGLSVFGLKLDNKERLWYTNAHGQFFFIQNDEVFLVSDLVRDKDFEHQIFEFKVIDNHLFAFGKQQMVKIDISSNEVLNLSSQDSVDSYIVYRNAVHLNGRLFVSKLIDKQLEILFFSPSENKLKPYAKIEFDYPTTQYQPIFFQFKNQLYILSRKERIPILYVLKNQTIQPVQQLDFLDGSKIIEAEEVESKLCILTHSGIYTVCKNSPNTYKVSLNKRYFENEAVTCAILDSNSNFWFTTLHNGVFVIPNLNVFRQDVDRKKGSITAMEILDKNTVVFGTNLGNIGIYELRAENIQYFALPIRTEIFNLLYFKAQNKVLVSTTDAYNTFVFDLKTKEFIKQEKKNGIPVAKTLQVIDEDAIFYSTAYKDYILKIDGNQLVEMQEIADNEFSVRRGIVFYDKKSQSIYKTFSNKLVVQQKDFPESVVHLSNQPVIIRGITQTQDGRIWVLTIDNKIHGIEGNEVVKTYSVSNGFDLFQSNSIKAYKNNLWLSNNHGIQLIETEIDFLHTFSEKGGLEAPNINQVEINDECLWLKSNYSIYGIYKRGFIDGKKSFKEEPYFTNVALNNIEQSIQNYYKITTDDKNIDIHFNTNGYRSFEFVSYRYKLEGLDTNWNYLPKGLRSVKLNNLPSGQYNFKLETLGNQKNTQEIRFKVKGQWYNKAWLVSLYAVLSIVSVLGLFFYLFRTYSKKKQEQLTQEQDTLKSTFSKQQKDEATTNSVFITETLRNIQSYVLSSNREDAKQMVDDYNELIAQYLNQSTKEKITLEEEIDTIKRYLDLEKIRQENSLFYTIQIASNLSPEDTFVPTQLILPQIEKSVQICSNNKKDEFLIIVEFKKDIENKRLVCEIQDNGNGRLAHNKKDYKDPLTITQEIETIAKIVDGETKIFNIHIEDLYAGIIIHGSRVTIQIPMV